MRAAGEMPEWPNGTDSKSVVLATVPRVQIPISPPLIKEKPSKLLEFRGLFFSAWLTVDEVSKTSDRVKPHSILLVSQGQMCSVCLRALQCG